jgi:DNA replication and repair protein RecF
MPIIRLDITDFRNIASIKFEPISDGFNLIYGDNGSGKTSLLESIYYLSLGRSFRSSNAGHIIRDVATKFAIYSHVLTQSEQFVPVGVERKQGGGLNARISGRDATSIAEVASLLPVQLINSNCYNLLDAGPGFRRKYLDWGAFYHSIEFLRVWRQFKRVLKQRNAALMKRIPKKELDAWNDEMVQAANLLHQLRQNYVSQLLPLLKGMVAELLVISDLDIEYFPGWNIEENYRDILARSLDRDLQAGFTQIGPHRANFNVVIKGLPAKDILSRGQQKLFVCAMILAQGTLLFRSQNKRPIYLVDDLSSELDMTSRSKLITLLSKQDAQIFVTAVEHGIFDNCPLTKKVKLFHVEHGNLKQI